MSESQPQIPIVDFGAFSNGDPATRSHIAAELTTACRRVGFVYIRNHGIPAALLEEAFAWSQRLFNLSREQKMLAPHPPGPDVHRGYSWPGLEKVSQYIHAAGDGDDAEAQRMGEELRKIEDYKVPFICAG
jgi:isopenicillin N synthase-like dioxygenase